MYEHKLFLTSAITYCSCIIRYKKLFSFHQNEQSFTVIILSFFRQIYLKMKWLGLRYAMYRVNLNLVITNFTCWKTKVEQKENINAVSVNINIKFHVSTVRSECKMCFLIANKHREKRCCRYYMKIYWNNVTWIICTGR